MFPPVRFRSLPDSLSIAHRVAIVSFFGQLYFFVPVMTPYLHGKGLSLAQIAGMQTTLMIAQLLMEVPTGVLADRFGHRRSYQLAMVLAFLGEVTTFLSNTYPQFLASQLIAGTGFAFASGSVDAYVYESLSQGDRTVGMQKAKGAIGAAIQLASLVAFAVGGWITRDLTYRNMRITLGMDVIGVGIGMLLAFTILTAPRTHVDAAQTSSLSLLRTAMVTLRANRHLRQLMILALASNAFTPHLLIFYQQYFINAGVPSIWLGWGLAIASGVAMLTQLHAWRLMARLGVRRGLLIAAGLPGVLYLLMAGGGSWPIVAVLLFIAQWAATQLAGPVFAGLYNEHIAESARATTLSLISGVVTIWIGIGGVLLGWLGERSITGMFAGLGVVIVAASLAIRPLDGQPESRAVR